MRRARKKAPKQCPIPEAETIKAYEEAHSAVCGRATNKMKNSLRIAIDTRVAQEGTEATKGRRKQHVSYGRTLAGAPDYEGLFRVGPGSVKAKVSRIRESEAV